MACTPLISRQAIPAIFCTTLCATLILPSSVDRRSAVPGLSSLVRAAGLAGGAELLVCVIRVLSFEALKVTRGSGGLPDGRGEPAHVLRCHVGPEPVSPVPRRAGTCSSVRSALLDTGRPQTSHIFCPGPGRGGLHAWSQDGRIDQAWEGRWDQSPTTLTWSSGPRKASWTRTPISSTVTGCWPTGWRCGCSATIRTPKTSPRKRSSPHGSSCPDSRPTPAFPPGCTG